MSHNSISSKKFCLNNGLEMPAVGLGTYRIKKPDLIMEAVDHALAAGYRMFDTAAVYYNEEYLKNAFNVLLPKYGLQRKDIFITTKLAPADLNRPQEACLQSLDKLGVDCVDLYLIHFPGNLKVGLSSDEKVKIRDKAWRGLVELYKAGKTKAIGVSNYTVTHLKELMMNNYGVVPTVNQVEWHPYYYQPELLQYCKENNILLQAYSSLGTSSNTDSELSILHDSTVTDIAKKLKISNAQLLLKWVLEQNVSVIPKSTNPVHIQQNIQLDFSISAEDMKALNALGKNNIKYAWNPNDI